MKMSRSCESRECLLPFALDEAQSTVAAVDLDMHLDRPFLTLEGQQAFEVVHGDDDVELGHRRGHCRRRAGIEQDWRVHLGRAQAFRVFRVGHSERVCTVGQHDLCTFLGAATVRVVLAHRVEAILGPQHCANDSHVVRQRIKINDGPGRSSRGCEVHAFSLLRVVASMHRATPGHFQIPRYSESI